VVAEWQEPTTLRELQSFLGLTNYFRRFIDRYSHVARPLTLLTGKGKFRPFQDEEKHAFKALKDALVSPPVLALPDFAKPFHVFTDASMYALGGILVQDGRPVAYCSRVLNSAELKYATPEQECLGIVHAYKEWRCYLEGVKSFCHTDHKPLVWLQSQPQLSRRQARWLEFLASFSPHVEYIPGKDNPADVLSRPPRRDVNAPPLGQSHLSQGNLGTACAVVGVSVGQCPDSTADTGEVPLWNEVSPPVSEVPAFLACAITRAGSSPIKCPLAHLEKSDVQVDTSSKSDTGLPMVPALLAGTHLFGMTPSTSRLLWTRMQSTDPWMSKTNIHKFGLTSLPSGLWVKENRLVVPDVLRESVLRACHDVISAGHPGVNRTLKLIEGSFWWPSFRSDVVRYVRTCISCQRNKSATSKPVGFLNPLPIPTEPFESISMDFVTELPLTVRGHDTLFVVVCRLTKMVHVAPCHHSLTASQAADLMLSLVFRLHGTPSSFYADRDKLWTSQFYQRWCSRLQIDLHLSSAYHPQSDGQTERMNRLLGEVLRHYVAPAQDNWDELLPIAEFAINRAVNSTTGEVPFKMVYGYIPKTPLDRLYLTLTQPPSEPQSVKDKDAKSSRTGTHKGLPAADDHFEKYRSEFARIRDIMAIAGKKQKALHDAGRRPAPDYQVGDKVYVDTKILRVIAVGTPKFLQRWQGPFEITKVIVGQVNKEATAVRVKLPNHWRVHPVFHVSAVKPFPVHSRGTEPPPSVMVQGQEEYHVEAILSHRFKDHNKTKLQFLVKWTGYGNDENSWVNEEDLTTDGQATNVAITDYWARLAATHGTHVALPGHSPTPAFGMTVGKRPSKPKMLKPAASHTKRKSRGEQSGAKRHKKK
jgi:RNase H-like domain found in reverse transcriptase/Integrase zinc binding domain/Chromo (CHRromatin Organisation MOdifier) domain/Integrase core domain